MSRDRQAHRHLPEAARPADRHRRAAGGDRRGRRARRRGRDRRRRSAGAPLPGAGPGRGRPPVAEGRVAELSGLIDSLLGQAIVAAPARPSACRQSLEAAEAQIDGGDAAVEAPAEDRREAPRLRAVEAADRPSPPVASRRRGAPRRAGPRARGRRRRPPAGHPDGGFRQQQGGDRRSGFETGSRSRTPTRSSTRSSDRRTDGDARGPDPPDGPRRPRPRWPGPQGGRPHGNMRLLSPA